ncbi:hypothetical protein, variant [Aphanomyces invadans]|uniref:Peptidase S9 prolyl oligopeptidase catalytic domain-containing protein n=1 Tax=Aphanomyces invadans TaxID=157072 RepID=A0A024UP24_9STRA|nr:hypothetical protein, variant [Aphanomyces invadans]ETW07900.1 hypothetical protein, variant [Aphanomyces invadans]|eukprot:XP_008863993.1 hypothetical protein, variant [Aphanomyces invadans]
MCGWCKDSRVAHETTATQRSVDNRVLPRQCRQYWIPSPERRQDVSPLGMQHSPGRLPWLWDERRRAYGARASARCRGRSGLLALARSLGGAVAVYAATTRPKQIAGLILENTFLSISAMVDQVMPWLSHVKSVVLRLDWGNEGRIPLLTHPILFVAGERDELVPHTHMQRLHALAVKSTLRAWLPIPRGTHNDSWMRGGMDYFYTLKSFIGNVVGEPSSVDTKTGQVKTPTDMVDDEDFKEAPSHIPNMLDQQSLLFQRPAKKIDQDEL